MKAIIIYQDVTDNEINGAIIDRAVTFPKYRILYYIPLEVDGTTYEACRADLEYKAKEFSESCYHFCNWSYSELLEIQNFFSKNARIYNLVDEFTENAII